MAKNYAYTVCFSLFICVIILTSASCSGRQVLWVTPMDGSEVWGIVRLQVKILGGNADEVNFYVGDIGDDHIVIQGAIIAENKFSDNIFSADWYTQNSANGVHKIYAAASFDNGERRIDTLPQQVKVNNRNRGELIPPETNKMSPANDPAPPVLSAEFKRYWHDPVPLGAPVNTAGAEDSAFITPDGKNLYFWFNADHSMDIHAQAREAMTGIYWAKKMGDIWQEPERLYLQYYDEIGMDGAQTVHGDKLWFASVRSGNLRDIDMWVAQLVDGRWMNWENAGKRLNVDYLVGELHITADGNELYYDSTRPGGMGGKDLWVSRKINGEWQTPELVESVNTEMDEGWPFVSQDGNELWFTRLAGSPVIFRSHKVDGLWGPPELVLSPLAGEPTLDAENNLYFTHHQWDEKNNRVSEADIYVCYRKE